MSRPDAFVASTIGRKVVMAVTGLVLFGFVFVHMLGNLQVFLPDHEAINHYGRFLREMLHGGGIWAARAVLLVAVVLHMGAAWSLTRTKACPVLQGRHPDASTYVPHDALERTVLLFVIYHLLHMTTGTSIPIRGGDVYRNIVVGFRVAGVVVLHPGDAALGLHLCTVSEHAPDAALRTHGTRAKARGDACRGPRSGLHRRRWCSCRRREVGRTMELRAKPRRAGCFEMDQAPQMKLVNPANKRKYT